MFKHICFTILVTLAAIAVLRPNLIQAQDRSGVLQGVVKDSSGAPVAGAFVKMKNAERRLTFMVVTQAQGRYSVNSLPAGKYIVQGIGGEYQSEPSAPEDVAAGKPANVDVALTTARFDPKTENFTEFPLASAESDPRRIEIDPTNPNRIWWSGNLSGRMGYVEWLK